MVNTNLINYYSSNFQFIDSFKMEASMAVILVVVVILLKVVVILQVMVVVLNMAEYYYSYYDIVVNTNLMDYYCSNFQFIDSFLKESSMVIQFKV